MSIPDKYCRQVNWVTTILFVSLSSLIFARVFEWDRIYPLCDPMFHLMTTVDKALLFWFLVAKTLAWFLPFLVILWCLMAVKLFRISDFFLITLWILSFFVMIVDLSLFSIQGLHTWNYIEFLTAGHMETAQKAFSQIWRFAGIRLISAGIFVIVVSVILVLIFFVAIRGIVARTVNRFEWLISRRSLTSLTIGFALFSLGIFSLPERFQDRVFDAFPLAENYNKLFSGLTEHIQIIIGSTKQHPVPQEFPDHAMVEDGRFLTKLVNDTVNHNPKPGSFEVIINKPNLPNVVLIVLESFRPYSAGLGSMKDLGEWGKQGLRLQRHYSGSNSTRPGLFSILSSQLALHQIRDNKVGFQMVDLLKRFGYRTTFITYRDTFNFMGTDDWYSSIPFDNFIQEGAYSFRQEDWPDSDRRKMKHALHILNTSTDRPNFLMVFLLSSHFSYAFPPEFEIFKSPLSFWIWKLLNPKYKVEDLLNRYTNSMIFLEQEIIMPFLRQLDLSRNIIIITGDHGESMKEDGVVTHGSSPSESQLRVPFIMVGNGVESREILTATTHNDILPTLLHVIAGENVPILNSNGRDLIADLWPADEVVVVPYQGLYKQKILIIRGDKRLLFKLSEDSDHSTKPEFVGIVDEAGQFKFKVGKVQTLGACW